MRHDGNPSGSDDGDQGTDRRAEHEDEQGEPTDDDAGLTFLRFLD